MKINQTQKILNFWKHFTHKSMLNESAVSKSDIRDDVWFVADDLVVYVDGNPIELSYGEYEKHDNYSTGHDLYEVDVFVMNNNPGSIFIFPSKGPKLNRLLELVEESFSNSFKLSDAFSEEENKIVERILQKLLKDSGLSVSDVIIAYPVSKSSSASKANPLDFEGSVWKEVGDMIKESDSKKSYANNKL